MNKIISNIFTFMILMSSAANFCQNQEVNLSEPEHTEKK